MKNASTLCFLLCGTLGSQSPQSIRPTGSFRLVGLIHDAKALNQAHDVEVQGGVAFVAGKGGNLALVDISKAGLPRLLASLRNPVEFEDAETVLPLGDVLFLGSRDFFAIDIRDPAHPKVLKKISQRPRVDRINGMSH
ncbi:MAG TPA: hypothetical protein VL285_05315 [Bryobacteraceae bacterium]|nr:hypothetical protein [Bryobacteraceae bacterium]